MSSEKKDKLDKLLELLAEDMKRNPQFAVEFLTAMGSVYDEATERYRRAIRKLWRTDLDFVLRQWFRKVLKDARKKYDPFMQKALEVVQTIIDVHDSLLQEIHSVSNQLMKLSLGPLTNLLGLDVEKKNEEKREEMFGKRVDLRKILEEFGVGDLLT